MFDEVAAAAGLEYFRLGAIAASPDHSMLATLVDDDGSERFKLRIRDLATGADIETVSDIAIGQPVWASDSKAVVFTEVNEHWRSDKARLHRLLGEDPAMAAVLYEETEDKGFSVGVDRSHDQVSSSSRPATTPRARCVSCRPATCGRAGADRAAAAQCGISLRRRPRPAVDRHQRPAHQFPAGVGAGRVARRVARGDRRVGPHLFARARLPIATTWR